MGRAGPGGAAGRRAAHRPPDLAAGVPRPAPADRGRSGAGAARPARPRRPRGRCRPRTGPSVVGGSRRPRHRRAAVRRPAPGPPRRGHRTAGSRRAGRRSARVAAAGHGAGPPGPARRGRGARAAGRGLLRHGRAAPAHPDRAARLQPGRRGGPADRRRARLGTGLAAAGPPSRRLPRPSAADRLPPAGRRPGRDGAGHRPGSRRLAGLSELGGRRPRHGARDAERRRPAAGPVAGAPPRCGLRRLPDRRCDRIGAVRRSRRCARRGGDRLTAAAVRRRAGRGGRPHRPRRSRCGRRAAGRRSGTADRPAGAPGHRDYPGHVMSSTEPVYLDHAATTPLLPEVLAAMTEQLGRVGNASSLHASGRAARRAAEQSRERLAEALGARPSEVLFTGGGTESDNLAVKGLFWARRQADSRRRRVVVSPAEHHAVLDSVEWLAKHDGADITWLPVEPTGRVRREALAEALGDGGDVAVASVMWANNEIGTVSDVAALAEVAHAVGVPLHTDAVQAVGQVPVDFGASGADALTMTGHKLGGPMGAGVLLLRRDAECTPLLHGGGQERDVRSGTLDVAAIVGLTVAAVSAVGSREERGARLVALRDRLVAGVVAQVPDAQLNGAPLDDVLAGGPGRLPGNAHLSFPGAEGDALLMLLDARGIECSTGSACSAGVARPSHVLLAVGADTDRARSSLRLSLGHTSTDADVDAVLEVIGPVVERARRAGLARGDRK